MSAVSAYPRYDKLKSELPRKGIHLLAGVVPLAYAVWGNRTVVMAVLAMMLAQMIATEVLRCRPNPLGRLFNAWFGSMLRSHESDRLLGATHYCIAALLCVGLMPQAAAVMALLFLAVGDTAASLVGMTWGRVQIGNKTLEGALAFWLSASLVAVSAHWGWPGQFPLIPALLAAPVAALAELLLQRHDDNWTVPLAAGGVIWALMAATG